MSAKHGGEEGRHRAVAGSRSECAAAERGVRYASKKGRSGRTPGAAIDGESPMLMMPKPEP